MRSRQARTTASQVVWPWPTLATISVAVSWLSGLMAVALQEFALLPRAALNHTPPRGTSERKPMPKKQISSEKISKPNGHFSQATVTEARGRIVFISGMTSRRPDGSIAGIGDIEAQTHQVCQNVKAAVEAAGGTMDDICRVDVYVRNMEHFEKIHKVRREYFKAPAPASTMVEITKMTSPEYLIEINAIAVLD
jgi:2-iminobutanoate/2-iminopropanoate deaminase